MAAEPPPRLRTPTWCIPPAGARGQRGYLLIITCCYRLFAGRNRLPAGLPQTGRGSELAKQSEVIVPLGGAAVGVCRLLLQFVADGIHHAALAGIGQAELRPQPAPAEAAQRIKAVAPPAACC